MAALQDLQGSIRAVRALINLEAVYEDPPKPEERDTVAGLRGAIIVLVLASFEGFLGTLFEEELDRIVDAKVPLTFYTEELQASAIFASLEHATKGDHSTRGMKRAERIPDLMAAARAVAIGAFVPRAMSSTQSNPNSDCVNRMFKAVGRLSVLREIGPLFELKWGIPVSVNHCVETLDALVLSRNRVAHTADSSHLLRTDLESSVRFIEVLAELLEADLKSHITGLIYRAVDLYRRQHA